MNTLNRRDDLGGFTRDSLIRVRLYSNGTAHFIPSDLVAIICELNVLFFPFDTHTCHFLLESARYTIKKQLIFGTGIDFETDSISHGEWQVSLGQVENSTILYNTADESFSRAKFSFILTRKSAYYCVVLIIPLLSISLVKFCVFFLPINSQERLPLSLTVLLAFSFFSSTIISELPHKSDNMPLLLIVSNTYMAVIAFVTILQAYSIHLVNNNNKSNAINIDSKTIDKVSFCIFTTTITIGTFVTVIVLPCSRLVQ